MTSPSRKSHHDPKRDAEWQVTQCACGQLTLRLGPIRIEFTAEEFAQLDRLVADAASRFEVVAEAARSARRPLTH